MSSHPSRVHVRTADGVQLSARVQPPGGDPARPEHAGVAVVVVHGFTAHADDANVAAVMTALSDASFTAVTYDARGHGASEGESTLGVAEQHDVAAAVALARTYAPRVVLVGTSMGGIAVLRHAAASTGEVIGVVTVACPAEWRLPRNVRGVLAAWLVQTRGGRRVARARLGVRIAPAIQRGRPPAQVARSVAVPVAVVHGTADPFIAVRAAELLHANLPGPSRLFVVDGLAHAFIPAERVTPAILEAMDWVLDHGS
ncbi:MAG: alpha/beta hydrolase [Actinomycetota bacterium]